MAKKKTLREINEAILTGTVTLRFTLELNVDHWGPYNKGDTIKTDIDLLNEGNGLARFSIEKRWSIVSCEFVNRD